MNLASIVLLLQIALGLLVKPNMTPAQRVEALGFAGQAVSIASLALQQSITTPASPVVVPSPIQQPPITCPTQVIDASQIPAGCPTNIPITDQNNTNNSLAQYNAQMTALNQQIINIENKYYSDLAIIQNSPIGLAEQQGEANALYQKEQKDIATIQLQQQQLKITYQIP